ncbi:hypothetical protein H5410_015193 [Solanum commersonii]|uniref:Uncharacterized protein n=1 Tax=Solanum commersonii TaxID=4109 RepID=A0A9J5ZT47_SOLCO|nr:hypothetical protein H5410_015193 [Solanum commersonii]
MGIELALQRRHQHRCTTSNVEHRARCWECIDEAIHIRRMSGIRLALLTCNRSPFHPSHSMCGVNPKAAVASHTFLNSSCDSVVLSTGSNSQIW